MAVKEIKASKYKNPTKEVTKVENNMSNKGNKKAEIPEKLRKLLNEIGVKKDIEITITYQDICKKNIGAVKKVIKKGECVYGPSD